MQLKRLSYPLALCVLVIATAAAPARSQTQTPTNPFPSNERDPLFGDGTLNPMDLIHRSRQINTPFDFESNNRNLDKATEDFRRLQQEALQQRRAEPTEDPGPVLEE
ncbi:MAG: hypothetical protein EA366_13380 [Spirulina sp. DLM2.Bin59]|nr:MAG: hypothetical protein EA366_13380 [Spirulina sp. DLM2.Bin59]